MEKEDLPQETYWGCKVGPVSPAERTGLAENPAMVGPDLPMRNAVNAAFRELVGRPARVLASGWGFETAVLSDEPEPLPAPGRCSDDVTGRDPQIDPRGSERVRGVILHGLAPDQGQRSLQVAGIEHTEYGMIVHVTEAQEAVADHPWDRVSTEALDLAAGIETAVAKLKRAVELEHGRVLSDLRDLRIERAEAVAVGQEREVQLRARREILDNFLAQVKEVTS